MNQRCATFVRFVVWLITSDLIFVNVIVTRAKSGNRRIQLQQGWFGTRKENVVFTIGLFKIITCCMVNVQLYLGSKLAAVWLTVRIFA